MNALHRAAQPASTRVRLDFGVIKDASVAVLGERLTERQVSTYYGGGQGV
jgi:hypothetical protein